MDREDAKAALDRMRDDNVRFHLDLATRTLPTIGNAVMSPLGVNLALGMLVPGATGRTREEIVGVLGLSSTPDIAEAYCMALGRMFPGVTIANLLMIQGGFSFDPQYSSVIRRGMGASLFEGDLQDPSTMEALNTWVSEVTRGKIDHLIDALDPMAIMVLINAIHLKRGWMTPFDPAVDGPFRTSDGRITTARMMRKSSNNFLGVLEIEGLCLCAAIPYDHEHDEDGQGGSGDRTMMVLVLPTDPQMPVEECLASIDGETWIELLGHLSRVTGDEVSITMPKFEIKTPLQSTQINEALKRMGIVSAFNFDMADFSKMIGGIRTEDLCLSRIIQAAYIRVDEQGTEAAAGTMGEMKYRGRSRQGDEIVLDRPFAFLIADPGVGVPSFIGIVRDPSR